VTVTSDTVLNTSPAWLDAEHLLIVSGQGAARDVIARRIAADGRPRGAPVRLTTGLAVHAVGALPGGRRVAYSVLARSANLWSVGLPPDGRPARLADAAPLTAGSAVIEAMDLSPDGRLLAFDSDRSGNQDIYVIPSGGGEAEPLVTAPADDFRPAFSRDGREIAYYSFVRGVRRLFIVPAGGGTPAMARPDGAGEEHSPDWSLDGTHILVHRAVDTVRQLFVLRREERGRWGEPRQLTRDGCYQGRWSPDGTVIACTSAGEIRLVDPATGATRTLLTAADAPGGEAPSYVRWSPDGREVFYKGFGPDGTTGIWAMPVAGGAPRLLLRFDDPLRISTRAEFATDGRRLWFTLEQSESDIWTMSLSR
jgi:Tol biopolymer transport system component